jgi:U3 small nucleolar RNA-associated protein 21
MGCFNQAVFVTACGNFGVASSSAGSIHMWNMQSGLKRKRYLVGSCPPDAPNRGCGSGNTKKERSITGLATDALNRVLVASTLDGTINVGVLRFLGVLGLTNSLVL